MGRSRRLWVPLAYLVVVAPLFVMAIVDGPAAWLQEQIPDGAVVQRWLPESTLRLALVALSMALLLLAKRAAKQHWTTQQHFDEAPGKPLAETATDITDANREILQAMIRVSQKYPNPVIRLYGQMLVDPARYQVRISDQAEPVGECLRVTVSTTFTSFPDELAELKTAKSPVMLIPMVMTTKGTMLDNVDTFDGTGATVPFLSQDDARGLVAHVVQGLFENTFGEGHETVLFALLRLVFRPGRVPSLDALTYFDEVVKSVRSSADHAKLAKLRRICSFLVRNYVIVGEVPLPTGYKFVLRYSKTVPLYGRVDSPKRKRRVRLGLQPNTYVIPLNLPFTANSYHFRMQAGPNSYVKVHYVQYAKSGKTVRQEDIRAMSEHAYLRVRHRQALPYAHLYTRRFETCRNPRDLVMQVVFDEVPPGTLGLTFYLAFLSALVITTLAFVAPVNNDRVAGDVLAFLLAISPVAATFVGYSMEKLQRSSLTTFVGLVVTGLTSIVAALLYVRPPAGWMVRSATLPGLDQFRVNVCVFVVGLAGLLNALYLYWQLRYELSNYVDMLTEKNSIKMMFR